MRQTFHVCTSPAVQSAWDQGQSVKVYGRSGVRFDVLGERHLLYFRNSQLPKLTILTHNVFLLPLPLLLGELDQSHPFF